MLSRDLNLRRVKADQKSLHHLQNLRQVTLEANIVSAAWVKLTADCSSSKARQTADKHRLEGCQAF